MFVLHCLKCLNLQAIDAFNGSQISTFFSDGCPSTIKAVRTCFPNVLHRLCWFHILDNLKKMTSGLLGDKYKTFKDKFRTITMLIDVQVFH